jgi:hypothetical protein
MSHESPAHPNIGWHILDCTAMPILSQPQETAQLKKTPSYKEIWQRTQALFGYVPCLWKIKLVKALLEHDQNVLSIATTGLVTFWMPLLFLENGIQISVAAVRLTVSRLCQASFNRVCGFNDYLATVTRAAALVEPQFQVG